MIKVKSCGTFQYKQRNIDHNKLDLIFFEKENICCIVDVSWSFDSLIEKKEKDKVKNYTDSKFDTLKMWKNGVTKFYIVLVVISASCIDSKNIR